MKRRNAFRDALVFMMKDSICHIGVELMPLIDTVLGRRSVRRYWPKEIPRDVQNQILSARVKRSQLENIIESVHKELEVINKELANMERTKRKARRRRLN
jgi:hypothetical protein